MENTRLNDVVDKIREMLSAEVEAAYNRGKADAKAEILALLSSDGMKAVHEPQHVDQVITSADDIDSHESEDVHEDQDRKRAPRGLPRALAEKVLTIYGNTGCTAADILEHAETDYEKMIKLTSIRSELRKGEQVGRYQERGGIWYLTDASDIKDVAG